MASETSPPEDLDGLCAFCAIARGADQSAEIVCQDEHWVAFFPLEPATPGHTLVIPRAHVRDFWSLDGWLAAELSGAAIRVGRAVLSALTPDGMNLISSSGTAAEQTVFHVHLHIVPRWKSDGFGRIWPPETHTDETLKEDVAVRIRRACAGR